MKSRHFIALSAVAAVLFGCWLVAGRIGERFRLRRALVVAMAGEPREFTRSGPGRPGAAADLRLAAEAEGAKPDGVAILLDLVESLPPEFQRSLGGYGWRHPRMDPVKKALLGLGSERLAAVAQLRGDEPIFLNKGSGEFRGIEGRSAATVRGFARIALQSVDPERALGILGQTDMASLNDGGGMQSLTQSINKCLEAWAATEPLAALQWAKNNAETLPGKTERVLVALETMARSDLSGAWEEMESADLETGVALPGLARALRSREDVDFFMKRISEDPGIPETGASRTWVSQSGAPEGASLRTCACVDLSRRLAGSEGWEEARRFLTRWADTPEALSASAEAVVGDMVAGAPSDAGNEAAADWLVSVLQEERRGACVEDLVKSWAEGDFSRPAEWLGRLPSSPWRDAGLAALCAKVGPFDTESAAAWAGQISDPARRAQVLADLPQVE